MSFESVIIFTDGASRGNPGPGGFGAVIVYHDSELKGERDRLKVRELGGREAHTTNNRMELTAPIKALQGITDTQSSINKIILYTDSSYVVQGMTKWIHGWQKNNWMTAQKKPVENRDLWEKLIETSRNKEIQWKQVGGHVGVAGNVRCDEIATAFAGGLLPSLYSGVLENYSILNIVDIKEDAGLAIAKSTGKSRSNARAYSYVSMVDGRIETHQTWAECERRVSGKRGVRYRKALSLQEEQELIRQWSA